MQISALITTLILPLAVLGDVAFTSETVQLTSDDIGDFSDIAFGNAGDAASHRLADECRYVPGDLGWPSDTEWNRLNVSIDGALLQPEPPAAACYPGPTHDEERCRFLVERAASERCTYKTYVIIPPYSSQHEYVYLLWEVTNMSSEYQFHLSPLSRLRGCGLYYLNDLTGMAINTGHLTG